MVWGFMSGTPQHGVSLSQRVPAEANVTGNTVCDVVGCVQAVALDVRVEEALLYPGLDLVIVKRRGSGGGAGRRCISGLCEREEGEAEPEAGAQTLDDGARLVCLDVEAVGCGGMEASQQHRQNAANGPFAVFVVHVSSCEHA